MLSRFGASDPTWFGAPVTKEEHEAQAGAAEGMLKRAAKIEAREVRRVGEGLEVSVVVSNASGHKFPTGYPSRRAFIHVVVTAPDEVARPSDIEALAARPTPAARKLFALTTAAPLTPVLVSRAEGRAP